MNYDIILFDDSALLEDLEAQVAALTILKEGMEEINKILEEGNG